MEFDSMEEHGRNIDEQLHDDFLKLDIEEAINHYESKGKVGPEDMDYRTWYAARMDGLMRSHNVF